MTSKNNYQKNIEEYFLISSATHNFLDGNEIKITYPKKSFKECLINNTYQELTVWEFFFVEEKIPTYKEKLDSIIRADSSFFHKEKWDSIVRADSSFFHKEKWDSIIRADSSFFRNVVNNILLTSESNLRFIPYEIQHSYIPTLNKINVVEPYKLLYLDFEIDGIIPFQFLEDEILKMQTYGKFDTYGKKYHLLTW